MCTRQRFVSCMQYAATIYSEIRKSKNVTDFDSIHNKLLTCSCKHFEHLM